MKDDDKFLLDRRQMLKLTASAAAIPCLLPLISGCGDTAGTRTLANPVDLDLDASQNAALGQDGGVVSLSTSRTGASYTIFVVRKGDSYLALSAECTHAGCSIAHRGNGFQCPCHGATFALDGAVTGGPAGSGLYEYPTKLDGRTLTVG